MPNDACENSWLNTPPPPRADRGIGGTGEHTDDLAEAAGVITGMLWSLAGWLAVGCVVALFWWVAR